MLDKLFVLSQYVTPQLAVSRLAGRLADSESTPALKNRVIKWFIGRSFSAYSFFGVASLLALHCIRP